MKTPFPEMMMIGWRETTSLPDLGLNDFVAKIDTGARTTALHAANINTYQHDGQTWVEFSVDHNVIETPTVHTLPVHHMREIRNTSGVAEKRIVVVSTLRVGARKQKIEISLSDRADMKYPMIVGRTALRLLHMNVNPGRSWLQSTRPKHKLHN